MKVRVPYCVHMDVTVDTITSEVEHVSILAETVYLNTDRQGFPVINVDDENASVSSRMERKAIEVAESGEWPSWDTD
jgi:hypothetical protein